MRLNGRTIVLNRYRTKLILIAIEDITEKKLIDARTEQFISMASHELRTPMTSIIAFMQLLEKKLRKGLDPKSGEILARVVSKLNELNALIRDLFDIRKIKQGMLVIKKNPLDLYRVVHEAVDLFRYIASDRKIEISGTGSIMVMADRGRIMQVVTNLLTNAVKYSDARMPVHIRIAKKNKAAEVSVRDYGIGIRKEDQKDIFDAYTIGSDQSPKKGLGMGLFICREIINLHGGKIWLESRFGKGSTFTFTLPVAE